MTREDEDLLLKDLCARLPYGVKVQAFDYDGIETIETLYQIYSDGCTSTIECDTLKNIHKPYLFPLSSMIEEQKKELDDTLVDLNLKALSDKISSEVVSTYEIDFYNKNHFDYRSLIPMGLAIDATGLGIY